MITSPSPRSTTTPLNLKQLTLELIIWFIAEILLALLGLDDLADYSEYLKKDIIIHLS